MLKDHLAKFYFDGNYNCAESVLRAGNEYYELNLHDRDMKLVGAYGAGIQTGNTCGALLGAAAILSMKYIEAKAHESKDIKPIVTVLMEQFTAAYGSTLCSEVKPQSFVEGKRCLAAVEKTCDILEKVIAEYESKES